MKNSVLIMDSWAVILSNLDDEIAGKLIKAICKYQATGQIDSDDSTVRAILEGWRPTIDANNATYDARVERAKIARSKKSDIKVDIKDDINVDINPDINVDIKDDINSVSVSVSEYISSNEDNIYIVEQARPSESDIAQIVDYLNEKTQKKFSAKTDATRKAISARLKEGYTIDDFKKVIDNKVSDWTDGDMQKYLRPQTLFRPSNFEAYLNESQKPRPSNGKINPFHQFQQNVYSDDDLERFISN